MSTQMIEVRQQENTHMLIDNYLKLIDSSNMGAIEKTHKVASGRL